MCFFQLEVGGVVFLLEEEGFVVRASGAVGTSVRARGAMGEMTFEAVVVSFQYEEGGHQVARVVVMAVISKEEGEVADKVAPPRVLSQCENFGTQLSNKVAYWHSTQVEG